MAVQGISWAGVLARIVIGLAVVFATYNPTGYSLYHWLTAPPAGITAVKALAGVALLICWLICLRTAYVSMGMVGMILGAALLAAIVWVMVDAKYLDLAKPQEMSWIVLAVLGILLGIGLGWSLIRARTTGQVEVD